MSTGQAGLPASTKEDFIRNGVLDGSLSEINAGVETLKRLQRETFQELMNLRQQFSQLERWRGKRPEDFTTRTTIRGSMECGASFVPTLRSEAMKGMKLVIGFDATKKKKERRGEYVLNGDCWYCRLLSVSKDIE